MQLVKYGKIFNGMNYIMYVRVHKWIVDTFFQLSSIIDVYLITFGKWIFYKGMRFLLITDIHTSMIKMYVHVFPIVLRAESIGACFKVSIYSYWYEYIHHSEKTVVKHCHLWKQNCYAI